MYAVSSFTEAKASFEDGLAGLDYLICGFRCPLPFLQIPFAVVARARGIQQHAGLDSQSGGLVEAADIVADVPVEHVRNFIFRTRLNNRTPVENDLVFVFVYEFYDVLYNLVVAGLLGIATIGIFIYDRHAAVHLDEFPVIVGLCNPGLSPSPAKVYAIPLIGTRLIGCVYAAVRIIDSGGIPVEGEEFLSVLCEIKEEMRCTYPLIAIVVEI